MNQHKILVTGASSGLGRFLVETSDAKGLRHTSSDDIFEQEFSIRHPYNAIIHCAFNLTSVVTTENFSLYLKDNLLFLQKVMRIPHHKFIFISTVDVYPKDNRSHVETDVIKFHEVASDYGKFKLLSEAIIASLPNVLVLRVSAMLGEFARPNSLIRMFKDPKSSLSLSGASTFNYVLYEQIGEFIKTSILHDLQGIFNVAASTQISLGEVAKKFGLSPLFGQFDYVTETIDNRKIALICPSFMGSSIENIEIFLSKFCL